MLQTRDAVPMTDVPLELVLPTEVLVLAPLAMPENIWIPLAHAVTHPPTAILLKVFALLSPVPLVPLTSTRTPPTAAVFSLLIATPLLAQSLSPQQPKVFAALAPPENTWTLPRIAAFCLSTVLLPPALPEMLLLFA